MTDHTLYLLRHAKSSWDEPLRDHERPLDARGVRDARAAGRLLAEQGWRPDLVLCSTAVRTRQTWRHAVDAGADAGEVRYTDAVYEASAGRLLELVQATEEAVGSLMLIGHGPGLPGLADGLGARPGAELRLGPDGHQVPHRGAHGAPDARSLGRRDHGRGRAGRLRGPPRLISASTSPHPGRGGRDTPARASIGATSPHPRAGPRTRPGISSDPATRDAEAPALSWWCSGRSRGRW